MNLSPGDKLWEYISNLAKDSGLVLYDLVSVSGGVIRVFLDKLSVDDFAADSLSPDFSNDIREGEMQETKLKKRKGSTVTSEDCSNFCRRLVHAFSVDGVDLGVGTEPSIEVSSPGLNRDLRLPEHYSWAVGHLVKVVRENGEVVIGEVTKYDGEILKIKEKLENKDSKGKKISSKQSIKSGGIKSKKGTISTSKNDANYMGVTDMEISEINVKISEIKRASVNY